MGESEDKDVIAEVLNGNTGAFAILLERYRGRVVQVVGNHVPAEAVDEVAQEVFISAYRSLAGFKGNSPFEHWISVIAVRRSYDYIRRLKRSREIQLTALNPQQQAFLERKISAAAQENFDELAQNKQGVEILETLFSQLDAEDQMVISLLYFEEKSVKLVAELLGWSASKVKIRAHRAKKKLKAFVESSFVEQD